MQLPRAFSFLLQKSIPQFEFNWNVTVHKTFTVKKTWTMYPQKNSRIWSSKKTSSVWLAIDFQRKELSKCYFKVCRYFLGGIGRQIWSFRKRSTFKISFGSPNGILLSSVQFVFPLRLQKVVYRPRKNVNPNNGICVLTYHLIFL